MLFAAWITLCNTSSAQENDMPNKKYKHEITIGYGRKALTEAKGYSDENNEWTLGNFHFQYIYNVTSHIGLGAFVDYTHSYIPGREVCFDYDDKNRFIGGHLNDIHKGTGWFTISPTARFYWFNHKYYAMYSRFGLGLIFSSGYDSCKKSVIPNISLVSMEFGNKKLRFCSELLSIGTYGVFNGGIKYSF